MKEKIETALNLLVNSGLGNVPPINEVIKLLWEVIDDLTEQDNND